MPLSVSLRLVAAERGQRGPRGQQCPCHLSFHGLFPGSVHPLASHADNSSRQWLDGDRVGLWRYEDVPGPSGRFTARRSGLAFGLALAVRPAGRQSHPGL